jgi:heterotetrameric sarcosine oxidase gamma subunit
MLPTTAPEQSIESPIGPVLINDDHTLHETLKSGAALADWTGRRLFKLQSAGAKANSAAIGWPDQPLGTLAEEDDFWSARVATDEYLLLLSSPAGTLPEGVQSQSNPALITVTDLTHGVAILLVAGSPAKSLLRKVCGLSFSDQVLPDHSATQTSLAKVRGTILRRDWRQFPAYLIIIDRSVGRYVWEIMLEASREFSMGQIDGDLFPGNDS